MENMNEFFDFENRWCLCHQKTSIPYSIQILVPVTTHS